MKNLEYLTSEPKPKEIKSLIILFHGYGASGLDLISLSPFFMQELKQVYLVAPNAPNDIATNAYYWFPLENFTENYLEQGYNNIKQILESFVTNLLQYLKLQTEQVILAGFSQGAMIALHYGLSHKERFKAIISFSGGALPRLKNEIQNSTPVCLIHGLLDNVLPVNYSLNTASFLEKAQHPFELNLIPELDHSINQKALAKAIKFILKN